MAVVHALTSGAAKDPLLMHLLRCLHFFTATYQISICARHVPGMLNTAVCCRCIIKEQDVSLFSMYSTDCHRTFPSPIAAAGDAHLALPRCAFCQLEVKVSFYLGQTLAPSTRQSYISGQRRFSSFTKMPHCNHFPRLNNC